MSGFFCPILLVLVLAAQVAGQHFIPNYDESKVPLYSLPDPLIDQSSRPVKDAKAWIENRRPEILELFQNNVYGRSPKPIELTSRLVSRSEEAVNGKAIRREIDLTLTHQGKSITLELLIYTPRDKQKAPLFLGLNFDGNHSVEQHPEIRVCSSLQAGPEPISKRGSESDSWPIEMIVSRGYGLATLCYADIDPDFDDNFRNGIHGLFGSRGDLDNEWGSIAGWAYGLSRVLDYLETDPEVDATRVAVIGHSRLGKTALWAGASDQRFKMTISNNSGCGGAALSRRAFGETVGKINTSFPHWFCKKFREFNDRENILPVDQHQLIALIAPRAVYIASASEDLWADPKGEFLSCIHADPVYRLLGTSGMGGDSPPREIPKADQPVSQGLIGYHLRTGKHALTPADWKNYLDFAGKHL